MPTEPSTLTLTTNIADVPGVGPRRADAFRRLGLRCVADLLRHLPLRYEYEQAEAPIELLEEDASDAATVRGEVTDTAFVRRRRPRFEATVHDGTGTVRMMWFNMPWLKDRLLPGLFIRATGKLRTKDGVRQMVNPRYELIEAGDDPPPLDARYRAVYPASEELASRHIERVIDGVLDEATAQLEDHLPGAFLREREMISLADAYRMVHRPADPSATRSARRRLAYDELLMLQLAVMLKRRHRRETMSSPNLRADATVDNHIVNRFPFALTPGQREVIDEISADLALTVPMNRLLQGDVGSGKTAVAVYAMLMAVASDHQAALMTPTELLAEQHYASIVELLNDANVRIGLLTGSMKPAERQALLEDLESGSINLLIGTHALLTETVVFNSLAVVVIDEQHRFGVHQRAALRTKASEPALVPHTLVMTATPIPRTLSLTIFGDLDVSTIHGLPPGRRPIATRWLPADRATEAYAYVDDRLAQGEQAYVVVPVIEESETGLTDLRSHVQELAAGPFATRRVEAVHGRLTRPERDAIMTEFRTGAIDVLVATTVIEVGVDVPNATMMVIEDAPRFGLAQLHQLRGRVGRGERKSVCVLIGDATTDDARQRLEAIVGTTDGFRIAEKDLEIRGPGELFGAKQSGLAPFFAASLPRDLELLDQARRDAIAWLETNPTLGGEDALLRRRLLKAHGETFGLGDVA